MAKFPFDIHATEGEARTGVLRTSRGDIRTPAFMPVGTAGTVKGVYMRSDFDRFRRISGLVTVETS